MFSRRKRKEVYLPGWLWFFLLLPITLVVALLYRQKRLPGLSRLPSLPSPFKQSPRYAEPDSIPLEVRTGETIEAEPETGTDSEDVALEKAIKSQELIIEEPEGEAVTAEPDDLKIIEGIGPSIAGILRDSGITTFRQLADTPLERLDEILTNANLRRLADPGTWAEQARLAATGDWDGLQKLQDTLKGGRRVA